MFEFAWPWMLILLPAPLLVYYLLPERQQSPAAIFAPGMISEHAEGFKNKHGTLPRILLLTLCWCSLVIGSAHPHFVGEPVELPAKGRDLMLAVDLSGSMKQQDMLIGNEFYRRIDALKYVLDDFISQRKGDRLGLIVFGTNAYLHAPISYDRETVRQFLKEAQIGFAGDRTSIGDAIGLAVKKLRERPEDSRILVLVTDGANTAGQVDPLQAAELAAGESVKIYTIGMGAERIVRRGIFGKQVINPSRDLDEETLSAIAGMTNGQYFRARDPAELQKIYKSINELEPIDQQAETVRPKTSLFHYFLAAALLLAFILAFIETALPTRNVKAEIHHA